MTKSPFALLTPGVSFGALVRENTAYSGTSRASADARLAATCGSSIATSPFPYPESIMDDHSCRISSRHRIAILATAVAALATAQFANAVPVFPGAEGFGTTTKAGREAVNDQYHIYKVTTLDDTNISNPVFGSLRYGIEKVDGPRVIVFEVSGVIELQKDLIVRATTSGHDHGYLTIAGQTAPFPGITLKNGGIRIISHDVLIQHIAIRPGQYVKGDETLPPSQQVDDGWELTRINNRDCIGPEGLAVSNIVVDHVTCSWSTDEEFTTWWDDNTKSGTLTNITVSNSIWAYPIQYAGHTRDGEPPAGEGERHGFGILVGPGSSNVSIVRNVMAFNYTRNPLIRHKTSGAQVINNFVYRPGAYRDAVMTIGSSYASFPDFPMQVSAIGNLAYLVPPVTWHGATTPTDPHQEGFAVTTDATTRLYLYLSGNYTYQPHPADPALAVYQPTSTDPQAQYSAPYYYGKLPYQKLAADPYANSGVNPILGPPAYLKWKIVPGAGKFSGQRDSYDTELMREINDPDDDSLWLEYQSDLGADPWAPVNLHNTRTFNVPNNPTGDDDGDGYTNLEEELHRWAAIVEGRGVPTDAAVSKFDTFTDGVADGWTMTGTGGSWSASGHSLLQSLIDQDARALLNGSSWTDEVVQARVQAQEFNTSGSAMVAVYARFNSINDAYYLTLRNNGAAELRRIKGGTITTYGSVPAGTYDPLAAHVLRLEVVGNVLRGYVDNALVLTGTDTEWAFLSGQVGIGGWHSKFAIDDVFASPLPAASYTSDDFDDHDATGWSMAETGAGSWSTSQVSGSTNWILNQTLQTGNHRASRAVSGRDQSTQAKVRFVTASDPKGFIAVYARYADVSNGYYVLLRNSRVLELKKIVGGVASAIATLNLPANFDLTAWHTLRVEASGGELTTLKAYLDGQLQLVGSDVDSPFTSGSAALGTYLTSAQFDDIVLSRP